MRSTMGRLPTGPPNVHIQKSHGADTNIMKFYITQNSSTYGRHWQNFKPRMGRHSGTGYSANFRPQVYYSTKLDELDNPTMGKICARNYHSVTEMSYQPYKENTGKEPLPNGVHQVHGGFTREKPLHIPTGAEANNVFIDTRVASAPANILPNGKPLLHKIQPKDPIEAENHHYGPGYMMSETKQRFKGKQEPHDYDLTHMAVGPLTESGFTHNKNIEPVTFYPNYPHINDKPGWFTARPTGISITKTSYNPLAYPRGNEPWPAVADPSDRESAFTKPEPSEKNPGFDKLEDMKGPKVDWIKKNDPMEYTNLVHPYPFNTTYQDKYQGQQAPDLSAAGKLNNGKLGYQELSGFSVNNDRFVKLPDSKRRFTTHYMDKFQDDNPPGLWALGHTRGGLQRAREDGFTASVGLHDFGATLDNTATLRNMEPYQARSIKARDRFYDDHLYDRKMQTTLTACM